MFQKIIRNMFWVLCLILFVTVTAPVVRASDATHGQDCISAVQLPFGTERQTEFANRADRAVYRVVLDARGLIDIKADFGSLNAASVELLDSACTPVRAFGGPAASIGMSSVLSVPNNIWTLAPGVYFVRFGPTSSTVFGSPFSFEATFTPHFGHDCATAEPMTLQETKEGELLYPEDREVFRVNLTRAGEIHAWTTGFESPNQPYVDLRMSDCSVPNSPQASDESGMGIVTSTLEPGTYYLSVEPVPNAPGPFILNIEFSRPPDIDYEFSDVPL
jgi:hypothetical protein